jgi:protein AATF/BFR2
VLTCTDLDPEDDPFQQHDSDADSNGDDAQESGGREHYETVGKSSLRKPEQTRLDAKYGGVAVSRNALEEVDDTNPFAPGGDDEDEDPFAVRRSDGGSDGSEGSDQSASEDEGVDLEQTSGDSDTEPPPPKAAKGDAALKKSKAMQRTIGDIGSEEDALSGQSDNGEDDSDGSDRSEEEAPTTSSSSRDKLKALNTAQSSESALVSSLTSSAAEQARKGAAVEQQQSAFDRLLDSRIKLQKAVNQSNDLSPPSDDDTDITAAAAKAETAALSLWSTIDSIRCEVLSHQSNNQSNPTKKRKISPLTPSTSTSLANLHTQIQSLDNTSHPHHQSTLNHWYSRTRPATAPSASRSALTATPDTNSITTVLDTYLNTNLPKLQSTASPSPLTYDDTPFYQSLLTSLIASRTNAASLPASLPSALPTRSQNPKVKKNVDTKASKGRKIRYTVHEKLQNFMAPEDRSTWTEEGRREFFGSLFGQSVAPGVADDGEWDGGDGMDADGQQEEGALRLFSSTVVA